MSQDTITFWRRLEPRPRTTSIKRALAAEVRDPLWFLTRQWQMGELQGEDAASPAHVDVYLRCGALTELKVGADWQPLSAGATPPEVVALREGLEPNDVVLATELGLELEEALRDLGHAGILQELRDALPPIHSLPEQGDATGAQWGHLAARVTNGLAALAEDFREVVENLRLDQEVEDDILQVAAQLRAAAEASFGPVDRLVPTAWRPGALRYGLQVRGPGPDGTQVVFESTPGSRGELDWYSHEQLGATGSGPAPQWRRESFLPNTVQFQGMPNARFWEFEDGTVDFGDLHVDKRDLARMAVLDFMLIQGNDWFLVPLELSVGSLCEVAHVVVRDVFGGLTTVQRASDPDWSMFGTSRAGAVLPADYLLLAPTLASAKQVGPVLEEVHFVRDEMANMAWAIEHQTTNALGERWPGHERAFEGVPSTPPPPPTPNAEVPLRYVVQTDVPRHWYPLVPVAVDTQRDQVELERAAMASEAGATLRAPRGRFLAVSSPGGLLRVREEEVPRTGTRLRRVLCRARGTDGSTHVWVERHRHPGEGEANSGLRFDVALPNPE